MSAISFELVFLNRNILYFFSLVRFIFESNIQISKHFIASVFK